MAGVPEPFLLAEILHVTHSAHDLDTICGQLAGHGLDVKGRGPAARFPSLFLFIHRLAGPGHDHLGVFDHDGHVGQDHLHFRPVDDFPAALEPGFAVVKAFLERTLHDAAGHGRGRHRKTVGHGVKIDGARLLLADQIGLGLMKSDIDRRTGVQTQAVDRGADVQTRLVKVNQEEGVIRLAADHGRDDGLAGDSAQDDIFQVTGKAVLVVFLFRPNQVTVFTGIIEDRKSRQKFLCRLGTADLFLIQVAGAGRQHDLLGGGVGEKNTAQAAILLAETVQQNAQGADAPADAAGCFRQDGVKEIGRKGLFQGAIEQRAKREFIVFLAVRRQLLFGEFNGAFLEEQKFLAVGGDHIFLLLYFSLFRADRLFVKNGDPRKIPADEAFEEVEAVELVGALVNLQEFGVA